jgi:hypothetical protein
MDGLLRDRKECIVESGGIDAGRQQSAPARPAGARGLRAEVERRHGIEQKLRTGSPSPDQGRVRGQSARATGRSLLHVFI